jgi:hypothetical protein
MVSQTVMGGRILAARALHARLLAKRPTVLGVYRLRGWAVSAGGHPQLPDAQTGPCALCSRPCIRYGSTGKPWCDRCQVANERIKGS